MYSPVHLDGQPWKEVGDNGPGFKLLILCLVSDAGAVMGPSGSQLPDISDESII